MEGIASNKLTFKMTDFYEQTLLNVKGYRGKEKANYRVQVEKGEDTDWVWASKALKKAIIARRAWFDKFDIGYGWEEAISKDEHKLVLRA